MVIINTLENVNILNVKMKRKYYFRIACLIQYYLRFLFLIVKFTSNLSENCLYTIFLFQCIILNTFY